MIVDVRDADVVQATSRLSDAGFVVTDYYRGKRNQRGGAPVGWVRLGAERSLTRFTAEESVAIAQDFADVMAIATFPYQSAGSDDWTAGDGPHDPPTGAVVVPMTIR